MNYANIITYLENMLITHKMVNEVNTGEISDINYPKDGKSPNYPYAFINPIQMGLEKNIRQFSFNLIMMTQCLDNQEAIIQNQSDMIEIISDFYLTLLSELDSPYIMIDDNLSITPFKERFSDLVVGGSVNLTLTFVKEVDLCDLPK